jgi:hypothetical protein
MIFGTDSSKLVWGVCLNFGADDAAEPFYFSGSRGQRPTRTAGILTACQAQVFALV